MVDRLDDQLSFGAWNDALRVRLSGTLDLEEYSLSQPATGVLYSEGSQLFAPRLSLFLDAQIGPRLYAFVQARADNGFDPGEDGREVRLDEFALRYTPWDDGRLNLQVGKFATVVGSWTPRHDSWDNPFITAPAPLREPDRDLGHGRGALGRPAAGVGRRPAEARHGRGVSPSSTATSRSSGGRATPPAPRSSAPSAVRVRLRGEEHVALVAPQTRGPRTQWQNPTFSGRVGFLPNEMWSFGVLGERRHLPPAVRRGRRCPRGVGLDQYREIVLGQDVGFAWHRVQLWAEAYEARFEIPGVGNADTEAYYVEAKVKLTPQLFGALRWNQQVFSSFVDGAGQSVRWSRNVWRADAGPGYRFTAHTQVKVQFSIEHQDADLQEWGRMLALQLTARF